MDLASRHSFTPDVSFFSQRHDPGNHVADQATCIAPADERLCDDSTLRDHGRKVLARFSSWQKKFRFGGIIASEIAAQLLG